MSKSGKRGSPLDRDQSELAALFDANPTGLVLIDRETRCIQQVNAAAARMIGLPAKDIVGKICHGFLCPSDQHTCPVLDCGQDVDHSERVLRTAQGDSIPILKTVVPITLSNQPYLLESFIDITERKQAEDALQLSEAKHRILLENSPDPFFSFTPDGQYTYVNQAFADGLGKSIEDILGKTIWDIFSKEEADKRFAVLSEVFRTGQDKVFEVRVPRPDGDRTYLTTVTPIPDEGGSVQFAICSSKNITENKQAEADLRERESNYLDLFHTVRQAIYIQNPDSTFINVNQGAVEMYGYEREQFIGRSPEFLSAPGKNDMEEVIRLTGLAFQGQPQQFEFWGKRRDGSVFPKDVRLVKGHYFGKEVLITVASDITERKQAEEALHLEKTFLSSLFDAQRDTVFLFEPATGTPLRWNKRFTEVSGYSDDEIARMKAPDDFYDQDELEQAQAYTANQLAGEEGVTALALVTKQGNRIPFEYVATPFEMDGKTLLLSIGRDLSERQRAEEALRDSEAKYRVLFETSSDGLLIADVDTRKFLYANPAMCRMLGYSEQEMQTLSVADIHPVEALKHVISQFEAQARGEISLVPDIPCLRKDGSVFPVDVNTSFVHIMGRPVNVGFFRDITERKRAEAEKAELEAALQQSQKMESVGRLAGGVAHDFNNMLGVILGHVEMAAEQIDETSPLHENLSEIRKAAERSADFTRQLLAFARKQTIAPQVLNLNESVKQVFQMLRRLIDESIDLVWNLKEDLWPVSADPAQIDQILTNLCVNACDAIGAQGQITINMENVTCTSDDCIRQDGFCPGDYVLLSVTDTGEGMDQETRAHIFEPFFTTKSVGEGTGLGLATAYGAVLQNNGFIDVISEAGKGSTFRVYLPRFTGQSPDTGVEAEHLAPQRGHETVLVVEDEPAILSMTRTMLKRQGYKVLTACMPGEAIRIARNHAGPIHLLLTDVVMPEMNGRALAKNLLSLFPQLKRLFMSGYTADVIAHNGVLDTGVFFIQKPFTQKQLASLVRLALDS